MYHIYSCKARIFSRVFTGHGPYMRQATDQSLDPCSDFPGTARKFEISSEVRGGLLHGWVRLLGILRYCNYLLHTVGIDALYYNHWSDSYTLKQKGAT